MRQRQLVSVRFGVVFLATAPLLPDLLSEHLLGLFDTHVLAIHFLTVLDQNKVLGVQLALVQGVGSDLVVQIGLIMIGWLLFGSDHEI